MARTFTQDRLLSAFFVGIVAILFLQALFPRQPAPIEAIQQTMEECIGEPIAVSDPYVGTVIEEWSCEVQCTDKKQHYLLYSNGVATQCETLPGCNDYGEDRGIRCRPPAATLLTPAS